MSRIGLAPYGPPERGRFFCRGAIHRAHAPVIAAKAAIQDQASSPVRDLHPLSTWWRGGRGVRFAPSHLSPPKNLPLSAMVPPLRRGDGRDRLRPYGLTRSYPFSMGKLWLLLQSCQEPS